MDIIEILKSAVEKKASDIFLVAGLPITFRINDELVRIGRQKLDPIENETLIRSLYALGKGRDVENFLRKGDDDYAITLGELARFRISAYKQRGTVSAVIRVVSFDIPSYKERHIPEYVLNLGRARNGMVLVTGPASSGKSTTLACVIDRINNERSCHIVTLEDPVEYLHSHKKSIVSQREIDLDTESYLTALRASLRQSPNVVLLGEMRDYETINVALTASETGHLLFSTLHTVGAVNAIDRIVGVFPPEQQRQVMVQLSMVLNAVVSQQLVPAIGGGLIPAFEIMTVNHAIRNMIREDKVHQIEGMLYSASQDGMISMDQSLLKLYRAGKITRENALIFATKPDSLEKKLD